MENVSKSKDWAISLKPEFVEEFRKGTKRYEVRTRVPKSLCKGDRLFVVESGSEGRVVLCLHVEGVDICSSQTAWKLFGAFSGITMLKTSTYILSKYIRGYETVAVIKIGAVEPLPSDMRCTDLGLKRAPQWFARIGKEVRNDK